MARHIFISVLHLKVKYLLYICSELKTIALPTVLSKLRLYCLRLSDRILILGNGGVKNTKTYEESKELCGYVLTLQNFDRLIKEGVKDGTIIVSENKIETDNTFDL